MLGKARDWTATIARRYDHRLWALFTVAATISVGFAAAMPFVSIYLYRELGVSMSGVGMIMLITAGCGSVGRIMGGEIADRLGRRPLLLWTMAGRALVFAVMASFVYLRCSYLVVAAAFIAARFVGALARPGVNAVVSDIVRPEHRAEAFGIIRIAMNVGWAVGPAMGGVLVTFSYWSLFAATAVSALIGFVLILAFIGESIREAARERFELKRVLDAGTDRTFLVFCFFSLLLLLVMGQLVSTLSVFSTEFVGISDVELGLLYGLNGAMVVFFQWPAAAFGQRIGIRRALTLGALLFAVGYLSVGLASSLALLTLSMVLVTLGEVVFFPSAMAAVANLAPADRTGRYMGFFGLAEAIGWSG
ncbi:MAG: MFS transporter, partial [Synergistales bacterium]|nr:MFS transporter [Synergistales bacterium]